MSKARSGQSRIRRHRRIICGSNIGIYAGSGSPLRGELNAGAAGERSGQFRE